MFEFSMSSLLMSVIFSNLLLIMLYVVFRNTEFMLDIGYRLLTVLLVTTLVRFLLPFELPHNIRIDIPQEVSYIPILMKKRCFSIGTVNFSLWHIFLILWLIGILIGSYRLFYCCRRFSKSIYVLGTDVTNREPFYSNVQEICSEQNRKNRFRVVEMHGISSPMITGLTHPIILIPSTLSLDSEKWYYVLSHEAAHYFHRDLWMKLFSKFLCILYWWNPLIYALQRQISTMLELRVDRHITSSNDETKKVRYMECLLQVARQEKENNTPLAISFCTTDQNLLLQRFRMMGDSKRHKRNRRKQIALCGIAVVLYAFSMFFIFEPYYVLPEASKNSYELTKDNAYFIVNPNGGYDLYMEDRYISTLDDITDETIKDLKVYKNKEEANHE